MTKPNLVTPDVQSPAPQKTRRQFLQLLGAAAGAAAVAPATLARAQANPPSSAKARYVYVGTYTIDIPPGGSHPTNAVGIYVYKMDAPNGRLTFVQAMPTDNPSFLAIDPQQAYLYCVNELGPDAGETTPLGRVSAYSINQSDGTLRLINTAPTNGTYPCHVWVHPKGGYLFAANYGGTVKFPGSFAVFKLNSDGSIGAMTQLIREEGNGTGPDPVREEVGHAHMILTDPSGDHVFGVDLGMDMVKAWDFDQVNGKLTPATVPSASVGVGSGCRHMTFHPGGKFAYVINELSSTVNAHSFDPNRGAFIWLQTVSTLPKNTQFTRPVGVEIPPHTSTCSEIRIHPTGHWLYGANRGANVISVFAVDQTTGKLTPQGWVQTQGKIPRGMNIDPSGTFMYVGNQDSDTIAVFGIDPWDGDLQGPLDLIPSPTPVDFEFGPFA